MMQPMLLLLAFTLIPLKPLFAEDLPFGEDKAKHFLSSAFLTGITGYALTQNSDLSRRNIRTLSVSCCFSLGLLKEIRDARAKDNHFCFGDIFWDAAGCAVGLLHLNLAPSR